MGVEGGCKCGNCGCDMHGGCGMGMGWRGRRHHCFWRVILMLIVLGGVFCAGVQYGEHRAFSREAFMLGGFGQGSYIENAGAVPAGGMMYRWVGTTATSTPQR